MTYTYDSLEVTFVWQTTKGALPCAKEAKALCDASVLHLLARALFGALSRSQFSHVMHQRLHVLVPVPLRVPWDMTHYLAIHHGSATA